MNDGNNESMIPNKFKQEAIRQARENEARMAADQQALKAKKWQTITSENVAVVRGQEVDTSKIEGTKAYQERKQEKGPDAPSS